MVKYSYLRAPLKEKRPQSREQSIGNLTLSQCELFESFSFWLWVIIDIIALCNVAWLLQKACTNAERIWNPSQLSRMTLKTANYLLLANSVSLYNEELSDVTSKGLFSADRSQEINFHIPRSYSQVQEACKLYIMLILMLININRILFAL